MRLSNPHHRRNPVRFGCVVGLLLNLWLGSADNAAASTPDQQRAESLEAILQLIGAARCSRDTDCRTVPIGHRACGGPDAYLAWSIRDTDPGRLQQAVAHHQRIVAASARPGQRYSTCEVLVDPGALCVPYGDGAVTPASAAAGYTGHCRLQPKQSGGRSPLR